MPRRLGLGLLATLLAASAFGCRTVWVHPEATAEKYSGDLFFCHYGVERVVWEAERARDAPETAPVAAAAPGAADRSWALGEATPAPAPGPVRAGWKRCMVNFGWDTSASGRRDRPWRTPRPPRSRYGKR